MRTLQHSESAPLSIQAWSWKKRLAAITVLLAIDLFLSFYHIQEIPLFDPDEPRYAAAGRTMAEGGSWIIPKFNGKPRLNKPPLIYWLVAVSDMALGEATETSARIPSILMGMLMLSLTVWMGARLYGDPFGFLAGLILCTSPLFLAISRTCIIDQTFSTLLSISLSCLLLGIVNKWPWPKFHPVLATGIFAGLAFMAKGTPMLIVLLTPFVFILLFYRQELAEGPGKSWIKIWLMIGVTGIIGSIIWDKISPPLEPQKQIIPFPSWALGAMVMAILSTIYYGLRNFWRASPLFISCLLILIIGGWWYLIIIVSGHLNIKEQFDTEIGKRLSGRMHKEPMVYYLYVFPALLLPWSVGIFAAMGSAFKKVTDALPLNSKNENAQATSLIASNIPPKTSALATTIQVSDAFLFAWIATVVIFFSIPGAKLGTYVLPAFPAAALLLARFILRRAGMGRPINKNWNYAILTFSIFLSQAFLFAALGPNEQLRGPKIEHTDIRVWRGLILIISIGIALTAAMLSAKVFTRICNTEDKTPQASSISLLGAGLAAMTPLICVFLGQALVPSTFQNTATQWQQSINDSPTLFLLTFIVFALVFMAGALTLLLKVSNKSTQPMPVAMQFTGFFAPVLASLIFAAVTIPTRVIEFPNRWQGTIENAPIPLALACFIFILFFCIPWAAISLSGKHYRKLAITQTAFILLTIYFAVPPSLKHIDKKSNRTLCHKIETSISGAERVFSVGCEEESLSYYLHRTVTEMRRPNKKKGEKHHDVILETIELASPGKVVLFVHHKYFKRWLKRKTPIGTRIIDQSGHIVVLINEKGSETK